MAEIVYQLRLLVYLIIYKVLYIPGGDRRISAINSRNHVLFLEGVQHEVSEFFI